MHYHATTSTQDLIVETAQEIRQAIEEYPDQPMQLTVLLGPGADAQWRVQLPRVFLHWLP